MNDANPPIVVEQSFNASIQEAMKAYTWGSSYGAFEEKNRGTLEVGKLADMAVIDTDLFFTRPKDWLEVKFVYTIVGGEVVYEGE